MPHALPAPGVRPAAASACPRRASTASAWSSCRPTPTTAAHCEELFEQIVREEGQTVLGWRDVPTDNSLDRPDRAGGRAGHAPGLHRPRTSCRACGTTTWPSSASCTSSASASRTPCASRTWRSAACSTSRACRARRSSTRACSTRAAGAVLPRPARPGDGVGPGAGPLALQHQHLPHLGAGASLPLHRPQRRDQHAARQRQLDARPRDAVRLRAVRRRHQEAAADHRRERQRLGHVRQRPGTARPGRPVAAARGHDDDPGAVERRRDA